MYNLFISHSWKYSDAYDKLLGLLRERPYFEFRNYSIPFDDPLHTNGTVQQLKNAIARQMEPVSCVLVLAGVYASYSRWIESEIYIAKNYFSKPKKVIAIEPWASERTSDYVKREADYIVKWNTESIIDAIRA